MSKKKPDWMKEKVIPGNMPLALKIVKKTSGAYALEGFSIRMFRSLVEYAKENPNLPRTWNLSQNGRKIILAVGLDTASLYFGGDPDKGKT